MKSQEKKIEDRTDEELYWEFRDLFNQYRNGPQPVPLEVRKKFRTITTELKNRGFFKNEPS